jgi:hypothetical protein
MEIKQRTYGLRIAATEAAFARNAELRPIPIRSFHPRTRPREAIGEMNKSEIELGRWGQSKLLQRLEICVVLSVPRHRHVNPLHRATTALDYSVRQLDRKAKIAWLHQMLVPGISVAKMESEIDVGRDRVSEIDDPSEQSLLRPIDESLELPTC